MKSITAKELKNRLTDGDLDEVLVDVREPYEFKSRHIPGAKNIPLDKVSSAVEKLKAIGTVYVHCASGARSTQACSLLSEAGLNVVNLEGGIVSWESAGFDVAGTGKHVLPMMRQVMIVAGLLILTGMALGTWVDAWWYLLSAFVGAGLFSAGVTGFCGMTYVLKWMPWNR